MVLALVPQISQQPGPQQDCLPADPPCHTHKPHHTPPLTLRSPDNPHNLVCQPLATMGVTVETTKEGDKQTYPKPGDSVTMDYTGTLEDGTVGGCSFYRQADSHNNKYPEQRCRVFQCLISFVGCCSWNGCSSGCDVRIQQLPVFSAYCVMRGHPCTTTGVRQLHPEGQAIQLQDRCRSSYPGVGCKHTRTSHLYSSIWGGGGTSCAHACRARRERMQTPDGEDDRGTPSHPQALQQSLFGAEEFQQIYLVRTLPFLRNSEITTP